MQPCTGNHQFSQSYVWKNWSPLLEWWYRFQLEWSARSLSSYQSPDKPLEDQDKYGQETCSWNIFYCWHWATLANVTFRTFWNKTGAVGLFLLFCSFQRRTGPSLLLMGLGFLVTFFCNRKIKFVFSRKEIIWNIVNACIQVRFHLLCRCKVYVKNPGIIDLLDIWWQKSRAFDLGTRKPTIYLCPSLKIK